MIERTHDAALIKAMLDDPDVAPNVTWLAHVQVADYLADPRNIALVDGGAGGVFEWSAPGVYETHCFFLPSVRGRAAIDAAKAFVRHMIDVYGAVMFWAQIRIANARTRWFARQVGMRSLGIEMRAYGGEYEIFVMGAPL